VTVPDYGAIIEEFVSVVVVEDHRASRVRR
jgi:hypothetical protein